MGSFHCGSKMRYFYWEFDFFFLILRAVVNILIQTFVISPWLLFCKTIISQLELGIFIGNSTVFFLSLREVANIPLQSLKISPWLLICKMIISQLELGLPVVGSAWVDASRSVMHCLAMCIQARDHVLQKAYWLHDTVRAVQNALNAPSISIFSLSRNLRATKWSGGFPRDGSLLFWLLAHWQKHRTFDTAV